MRLICPNCDAQYDVPDSVIPTDGRDVQCSSCGTTWFQHHPDNVPEAPVDQDQTDSGPNEEQQSSDTETSDPDEDDDDVESSDTASEQEDTTDDSEDQPADDPAEETEETQAPAQPARQLDSSVQAILRAEAERETEAREVESLETQPDLGLDEANFEETPREREARERMARLRGEQVAEGAVAAGAAAIATTDAGSRRDLLPDIEEINSTLRPSNDRRDSPVQVAEEESEHQSGKRSGGFKRGFVLVVALAAIAALVYSYSPQLAQQFPQLDSVLNSYVAQVDVARVWLDSKLVVLLTWLDKTAAATTQ